MTVTHQYTEPARGAALKEEETRGRRRDRRTEALGATQDYRRSPAQGLGAKAPSRMRPAVSTIIQDIYLTMDLNHGVSTNRGHVRYVRYADITCKIRQAAAAGLLKACTLGATCLT